MSFHEVQFPTGISYGSRGGPGHNTSVIELDSGAEERIARWSTPRCNYDVSYGVKSYEDLADVIKFARAREGAVHGFRFKDWSDYTSASDGVSAAAITDQTIGTGDGVTTTFQLTKTYTSGATTRTRTIEKPVSGTVLVEVDGVAQTEGVDFTFNTTTGLITFTTVPGIGLTIKAGFQFDVPVRFGLDVDELLDVSLDDYSSGSVQRISVVEIKDEAPVDESFFYRGSQVFDPMSANVSITPNDGAVLAFNVTTTSLEIQLPDPANYAAGGPYHFVTNIGSQTVTVKRSTTTVLTLGIDTWGTLVIGLDASGAKTWYGF